MKNKTMIEHQKGRRHIGKTNWIKVYERLNNPIIDKDNPELVMTAGKVFKKADKLNKR